MKRLLFIFAILIVLAVVGVYTFMEFSAPEISYVTDIKNASSRGNELVLHRLYTSGINIDEFYEKVEKSLISAEFNEDEIYLAALASGTPEFYPAFYLNIYYPDPNQQVFNFSGQIRQEFAKNQANANFDISNIHLELLTEGLTIENVETTVRNTETKSMNAPIVSEDKRSMAINLDNVAGYSFNLNGTAGKVTFQFTYDVVTNSLFPTVVMPEQLLVVYANVKTSETDGLVVEYISEPYSTLEDME